MYEDLAVSEAWNRDWMPRTSKSDDRWAYFLERARCEAERQRRRQVFMDQHGLKRSRGVSCLARVVGHRLYKPPAPFRLYDESKKYPDAVGWFDHSELFYRGPKDYVLTTQPYGLNDVQVAALRELCDQHYLIVDVLPSAGWHYPGRCPLVVVRKFGYLPT